MKTTTKTNKIVISGICVALCVVLPIAFHAVPGLGSTFSPMHIPVLLCGLVCGAPYGLLCGIIGPVLSSFLTGMPMMAYLPGMVVELAVYGFMAGLILGMLRKGKLYMRLYVSLILSMILGRIAAGAVQALIFSVGEYSMEMWMGSYFIGAWPAIILHLVLVPAVVIALEKAKLIHIND